MAYRSSTGNLGFYEDDQPRPQRWDRDRFERARSRGATEERIRFEENDRFGPRSRDRRELDINIDINRRTPEPERERLTPRRQRFEERDRVIETDRYGPPPRRSRPEFLEEPIPAEVANRALAPYRRKSVHEREYEAPVRAPRPGGLIRRQSSLDTFDRRPLPRYSGELDPPPGRGVPVPAPLPPRREYLEPRGRFREDDYEEIEYRDYEPKWREEDYRDIRIRRERSRVRRPARSVVSSKRSSSSSSFEEVSRHDSPPPPPQVGKRGRTKMPKRLVKREALEELSYPFEEEEDFLIVKRALGKEQIDEVIKITEKYKEPSVTTYRFEEPAALEPPPPPASVVVPPPPSIIAPPPPPPVPFEEIIERREIIEDAGGPPPPPLTHVSSHHSTVVREPSPPESIGSHHSHHTHHTHRSHNTHRSSRSRSHSTHHTAVVRSVSPRREIVEERYEEVEGGSIGGPLTVIVPEHRRRSERDIKAEIRRLEAEKRALRLERDADVRLIEADRIRDREYEIVEPREVVRVEKDRRGRMALVRSTH
ncbi:MAG: hypothetical protein M1822_005030 [Bathelium mastoideum]|nr:MAG: hypothetical protein M1822_005030 [Bathelium mastoideum]